VFGARAGARGTQRAGGIACLYELHQLDVAPRHLEEGSDLLEDACRRAGAVKRRDERPRTRARTFDAVLGQLRPIRRDLLNRDDLWYLLAQPALEAHLHRHRRRRTRAARALQLEPHDAAIDLSDGNVSTVGHEVRAHLIKHSIHILRRERERTGQSFAAVRG